MFFSSKRSWFQLWRIILLTPQSWDFCKNKSKRMLLCVAPTVQQLPFKGELFSPCTSYCFERQLPVPCWQSFISPLANRRRHGPLGRRGKKTDSTNLYCLMRPTEDKKKASERRQVDWRTVRQNRGWGVEGWGERDNSRWTKKWRWLTYSARGHVHDDPVFSDIVCENERIQTIETFSSGCVSERQLLLSANKNRYTSLCLILCV